MFPRELFCTPSCHSSCTRHSSPVFQTHTGLHHCKEKLCASLCIIRTEGEQRCEEEKLQRLFRCWPLDLHWDGNASTHPKKKEAGNSLSTWTHLSYSNSKSSNLSEKHTCCMWRNRWRHWWQIYANCTHNLVLYTEKKYQLIFQIGVPELGQLDHFKWLLSVCINDN